MCWNILILFWLMISLLIILLGLINRFSESCPQIYKDLIFYGKIQNRSRNFSFVQLFEIPKRYFLHFYLIGSIINSASFFYLFRQYLRGGQDISHILKSFESILLKCADNLKLDRERTAISSILLLLLMSFQDLRRMLECLLISVFSTSGKMNFLHFLCGLLLYSTFPLTVLIDIPGDTFALDYDTPILKCLSLSQIFGIALYLWSAWQQNKIHCIFAKMRMNADTIMKNEYKLPCEGWFQLICCPHYFFELLIYVSYVLVGDHMRLTLLSVIAFVFSNQIISALNTLSWYRQKFKEEVPKNWKAIIPFIL